MITRVKEETKYKGYNVNNRLSIASQINDKSSIGLSYYIATNKLNTTTSTVTDDKDVVKSAIEARDHHLDNEATLKYTSTISKKGGSLVVIGDWFNRQSDSNNKYSYNNLSSTSKDKSSLNMYKLSVDFTTPVSRSITWKYGTSIQQISSKYVPKSEEKEADRFPNSLTTTHTNGLTPLVYAQTMGQIGMINYSAGVSWQLNRIGYTTPHNGEKSFNTQWGINPTIQLMMPT